MNCYAIHHRVFGPLVAYYADSEDHAMHKYATDPETLEFEARCADMDVSGTVSVIPCDPETVNCEVKD